MSVNNAAVLPFDYYKGEKYYYFGVEKNGKGETDIFKSISIGGVWATEPTVGRVAHGVSARMDRLRSLGNAVVPQVVEIIGRAIMKINQQED